MKKKAKKAKQEKYARRRRFSDPSKPVRMDLRRGHSKDGRPVLDDPTL